MSDVKKVVLTINGTKLVMGYDAGMKLFEMLCDGDIETYVQDWDSDLKEYRYWVKPVVVESVQLNIITESHYALCKLEAANKQQKE